MSTTIPTNPPTSNSTATHPSKSDSPIIRNRSFTGHYHYRASLPLQITFEHFGDLKSAKERFRQHCVVMNYKYINVRPFLVDLDDRERRRNEEENYEI